MSASIGLPAAPVDRLRRVRSRRPYWWLYACAALASLALLLTRTPTPVTGVTGPHEHVGTASAPQLDTLLFGWAHWVLMTVAMMLPVVAPLAGRVAVRSLRGRRERSMGGFLLGYLTCWALVGLAVLAGALLLGPWTSSGLVLVVTLVIAAHWQVARPRRRLMRRCGSLRLGAAAGWAADRNCMSVGWTAGCRCVATCGPVMVACAISHSLLLMAGVVAIMLNERRRGPNPALRAGRQFEGWLLIAMASIVTASMFVA